jgi:hypothetical protein
MIMQLARSPLSVAAQIAEAAANHVGKLELAFRAAFEGLYAAHNEKVQMRLAPPRPRRLR